MSKSEPQVHSKSTDNSGRSGSKPQAASGSAHGRTRESGHALELILVAILVIAAVACGWFVGRTQPVEMWVVDASFTTTDPLQDQPATASDPASAPTSAPTSALATGAVNGSSPASGQAQQIGQLKAEMLRLRVLFQRLAEVAEIEDEGEFDLDFEIDGKTGDGEPLSRLDPTSPDALAVLFARLDPMIEQVNALQSIYLERRRVFDRRLSGRPLAVGSMSSGFGRRVDPLTGRRVMHHGLDFVGEVGEPIMAIADGVVTWSGRNGGYGLLVELEHAGDFSTRYAHNDVTLVRPGDRVRKGEIIATLGSSGRSTGPHLHLEVRHRGTATDPGFFIR